MSKERQLQAKIVALEGENESAGTHLKESVCWKCGGGGYKPAKKGGVRKRCSVCTTSRTAAPKPVKCAQQAGKTHKLLPSGARPLLLRLEYDGTGYIGSQSQPANQGRTIQRTLEEAASRLTDEPELRATLAGRTDKGVHAKGMAALLWTASALSVDEYRRNLNRYLPDDMVCIAVALVTDPAFDPRTDAVYKWYRYSCTCGEIRSVIGRAHHWHLHTPLDIEGMRTAAAHFVGQPLNFSSFTNVSKDVRAMQEGEWDPICLLHSIEINTAWDDSLRHQSTGHQASDQSTDSSSSGSSSGGASQQLLTIDFKGNRFLYKMVRALVGTLVAVGRGELPSGEMPKVLGARQRDAAGPGAPAKGLCLQWVYYGMAWGAGEGAGAGAPPAPP
jgi:tRNA pseudouridine38-40 synthase